MSSCTQSNGCLFFALVYFLICQAIAVGQEAPQNPPASASAIRVLGDNVAATRPGAEMIVRNDQSLPAATKLAHLDKDAFSLQISNDTSIVELLRQIGNQAQLSIIPSSEVRGTVPAMELYHVSTRQALDAILHATGMAWKQQGDFIYVYSQRELIEQERASRVASTEVFHLYFVAAADAANLIKPALGENAKVAFGPSGDPGINTKNAGLAGNLRVDEEILVITDFSENLAKVRKILKEIDHCPPAATGENFAGAVDDDMLQQGMNIRLGIRAGVTGAGRRGLAEAAYESARLEMDKPNPNVNKALWFLESAANLDPEFSQAIELKQRLIGKRVMQMDSTPIRSFVRGQAMGEALASGLRRQASASTQPSLAESATTQPSLVDGPAPQPGVANVETEPVMGQ